MQVPLTARLMALFQDVVGRRPEADDAAIVAIVLKNQQLVQEVATPELFRRLRAWRKSETRIEEHPYQMFFVGYGFRNLSEKLPVDRGGSVELKDATIADIRKCIRALRATAKVRVAPKIASLEQLVKDMRPFAQKNHHITFGGYCDMLASGEAPPPTTTPEERSAIAKARWQRLTPAAKKAMQAKRLQTRAERREDKKRLAAAYFATHSDHSTAKRRSTIAKC